ncbi:hypothetical protein [Vallitalea guaymasensis]|uniref:hypothetical protein n=1 Tax=Vallitalea guaymasensis TaxID=1185412 RepID=UPI000DE1F408|nr:hypothetical protein [Vallitalea guaymasensis]
MAKSYEELATEITVAWLKATGESLSSGQYSTDAVKELMLKHENIEKVYTTAIKSLQNSFN